MKLTYLGTAAAEGMPAVFCDCKYCNEARRLGGKNIRTRSQAIINDDLLIDLPADTYSHFLSNGILGHEIKYLFVTHSHHDHLYAPELNMRSGAFAHDMEVPTLEVFCSNGAYNKINFEIKNHIGFKTILIKPYETVKLPEYEITPLPARHYEGDNAVFYIIKGEKTILYAHDTGYFHDEVFDYLKSSDIVFDLISLDCTNVDIKISDEGSHMGIENIERLVAKLSKIGVVNNRTIKVINHFSHNANPLQKVLEKRVKPFGFKVAYDGMKIEV